MQCRRAIQHHRMFADHVFENVPDQRLLGFNHAFCGLDGGRGTEHFQFMKNERLEQLERHFLWQSALMQLQRWAHHDHRTPRVIDALAQQVLTETTRLALDHVGQRLQRALVGTGHGFAATTVVEQ